MQKTIIQCSNMSENLSIFIITFFLILNINLTIGTPYVTNKDDTLLNDFSITDYASKFGYPAEVHKNIQTEDGYLLDIHRIPHGRKNNNTKTIRPVVFIMHGMVASADCWVVNGPRSALAFLLADRGYDVWLGNARGTSHSKKHVSLTPKSGKFWDFSWHEIGYYDVPACINYILRVTEEKKLFYIGHSQGGTAYFIATSMRPEFNNYIKLFVGLAPGAFYGIEGVALPQEEASSIFGTIEDSRKLLGINEIGPQLRELACQPQFPKEICRVAILYAAFGAGLDPTQFNFTTIPEVEKIFPDSASARQFLHYMQCYLSASFRNYDFGPGKNVKKYGSKVPPSYNLKKSTAPAVLYSGIADVLVTTYNTARLRRQLPNVKYNAIVPYLAFTHLDFVLGKDVVTLLYNSVFSQMDKYNDS